MMLVAALVLALVFVSSFISGVFGVAGGLILMGALLYLLPVSQAMLVHGLTQFISNGARVLFWRSFLETGLLLRFLAGSLVCLLAFTLIRFVPSRTTVLFLLGLSTVIVCLVPQRWAPRATQPGMPFLMGIAGTALMLTAGVSGPFLDQFFVRAELDRRTTVATKAAMQAFSHLVKAGYFGALATTALDAGWWTVLAIVPVATAAGTGLASRVLVRLSDRQFYWWTRRIVLAIGVYYLADALRQALTD